MPVAAAPVSVRRLPWPPTAIVRTSSHLTCFDVLTCHYHGDWTLAGVCSVSLRWVTSTPRCHLQTNCMHNVPAADDLWDLEADPKPKRRPAQRRKAEAAARSNAGSDSEPREEEAAPARDAAEDTDLDDELAADVAAAARGAGGGRKRARSAAAGGNNGGGVGVDGSGSRVSSGSDDAAAAAGSRKRRPLNETEKERKARLLRTGRGLPPARSNGAFGSGAAASAALSNDNEVH